MPASRTAETLRPAQRGQIVATGLFAGEAYLELEQVAWIILHEGAYYILGSPESSGYPIFTVLLALLFLPGSLVADSVDVSLFPIAMAMSKDKQTLFVIGTDPAESEDTLHVIDIPSRQATQIKLPNSTTSDVRSLCVGPSSVAIPSPGGVILVLDPDTLQIRSVTTGNILFPHSCTFGPDGSLYVGADSNGGGLTPEVEVFSPQLNLMAEFELGTGSVSAMAAADNGKVLFVF